jgi:hypothetical protein
MLGRHGREGLGKNHGFPMGEQKKKDRYEGQPYFHSHFFIPAFNASGFIHSVAKPQPENLFIRTQMNTDFIFAKGLKTKDLMRRG